jgi:hypothetical protein
MESYLVQQWEMQNSLPDQEVMEDAAPAYVSLIFLNFSYGISKYVGW